MREREREKERERDQAYHDSPLQLEKDRQSYRSNRGKPTREVLQKLPAEVCLILKHSRMFQDATHTLVEQRGGGKDHMWREASRIGRREARREGQEA